MKIAVKILDIDEKIEEFKLEKSLQDGKVIWTKIEDEYSGPDFVLKFILDKDGLNLETIEKGNNIVESESELKHRFSEALFEERMKSSLEKNDGFDAADESEADENDKIDPYNPKLIRVDTKQFPIYQINQMIKDGDIDLSPDFQRGFVWNDITRKSRLIESLLLRIPLPVFYFAQDEDGLFQVVDGVQRLTVIKSFLNNEFKLKNLEYLHECEDKWYKNEAFPKEMSLTGMYARRIEMAILSVNIIDPQTPSKVKYDIFKRINTGGRTLNNQEMRNCFAAAGTRQFLHSLSKSEEFISATRGSISPVRMADEELILRFIAFFLIDNGLSSIKEYKGGMNELLDETVNILNKADLNTFKFIRTGFLNAMHNAYSIFGDKAFRKASYINKALFLGVTRVFGKYSPEEMRKKNVEQIRKKIEEAIRKNGAFTNALSMATNDARNVNIVYQTINKIVEGHVNEQKH